MQNPVNFPKKIFSFQLTTKTPLAMMRPMKPLAVNRFSKVLLMEKKVLSGPLRRSMPGRSPFHSGFLIMPVRFRTVAANFHCAPFPRPVAGPVVEQPSTAGAFADPVEFARNEQIRRGPQGFTVNPQDWVFGGAGEPVSAAGADDREFGGRLPKEIVQGGQIRKSGKLGVCESIKDPEHQFPRRMEFFQGKKGVPRFLIVFFREGAFGFSPFHHGIAVGKEIELRRLVPMVVRIAEIKAINPAFEKILAEFHRIYPNYTSKNRMTSICTIVTNKS